MKHTIFTFLACLLCLAVNAQQNATALMLTHCDGRLSTTGSKGCSGEQWNSAATWFSADEVAPFVGNRVSAVRIGVSSKLNVDQMVAWVRTSLDGENLAEASSSEIAKGWMTFTFDKPVDIDKAKELYIGFSYHQKGTSKCLATLGDRQLDKSFFFKQGDGEWTDCSLLGIPCIEGFVTGDNLPLYDLGVSELTVAKNYLVGTPLALTFRVSNKAAAHVNGFTSSVRVAGATPVDVHTDCSLDYGEETTCCIEVTPQLDEAAMNALVTLEITAIDGGNDSSPADNMASTTVNILLRDYERHMLIEEFTGEACVNCPPAANMLHQLLDDPAYSQRVSAVCHHIGFGTDNFSTDNARQYLWFYNSSSSYAPAFMWDRSLILEEKVPVTTCPSTLKDMKEIVDARLATTSLCDIRATADYAEDTRQLKVTVYGERSVDFCDTPAHVTVFVTEDNVEAFYQAGATTKPYYHQHVLRGYNATFGSVIDWNEDNTFSYDCQIEIGDDWNTDNLNIVAFVSAYDPDDPANCAIENSCEIGFPKGNSGITAPATATSALSAVYTITGQRTTSSAPHLQIRKYSNGRVVKTIVGR